MDWMTDRIAIGNVDDAINTQQLRGESITALLSLYSFPTPMPDQPLVQRQVLLQDGAGNSVELLHEALSALDTLLTDHKVLVHCMEGASRSPFVVACHLALHEKISLLDAVDLIRRKRRISISPYFYTLWDEYLIWRDSSKGAKAEAYCNNQEQAVEYPQS